MAEGKEPWDGMEKDKKKGYDFAEAYPRLTESSYLDESLQPRIGGMRSVDFHYIKAFGTTAA